MPRWQPLKSGGHFIVSPQRKTMRTIWRVTKDNRRPHRQIIMVALSTGGSIERRFQMSFSKQIRPRVRKNVIVGNMITWNAKKRTDWFSDDGLIEKDRYTAIRRCPACLKPRTIEGHDPCLGTLPGVN